MFPKIFLFVLLFFVYSQNALAQSGIVNADLTKLRTCADRNCSVIKQLAKGTIVNIIGRGKSETIDSYGKHPWLKVKYEQTEGFIFGALIDFKKTYSLIAVDTSGYLREDRVNVRAAPRLQNSVVLFQLKKGVYCKVHQRTQHQESIDGLGQAYWYLIEINKRKGYVFGALLTLAADHLTIDSSGVYVYDTFNAPAKKIQKLGNGKSYKIRTQSPTSFLKRPYGRHYWYQLEDKGKSIGWVYGAFTSKQESLVDCQCVDFVKNTLGITGPTKNAFEWKEVLYGRIPVTVQGQDTILKYQEIFEPHKAKKGDIVILDKVHPETDNLYGHIGILHQPISKKSSKKQVRVSIEGSNHKLPLRSYYPKVGCNNVSVKAYFLNDDVRFYRPIKK